MDKQLIDKYIALPMAINVMRKDKQHFSQFEYGKVYIDVLDEAIERATREFYELKSDLLSEYHVEIKRIDRLRYRIDGEVVEYGAGDLKGSVNNIIKELISYE